MFRLCRAAATAILGVLFGGALLATTVQAQPAATEQAQRANALQAQTQVRARGEALFNERCKSCHAPPIERAPNLSELAGRGPDDIIDALKTGKMQPMATGLSKEDMAGIVIFLTGRAPSAEFNFGTEGQNTCPASARFNPAGPSWNGWSPDKQNTRVAAASTITAANAPNLKVKWAFAFQGARYGQPSVVGNRVFVTSSSGRAYALDTKTGCVAWAFTAKSGPKVTVSVGRNAKAASGYAAYLGDIGREVYALDANSGKLLWSVNVEAHPRAVLTGAPALHDGILYVPLSTWEETTATAPAYQCCTARGGIVAVDTATGKIIWKQYTIPVTPAPFKKNAAGTQMFGPAGAAVWSSPTIDPKRGVLYVATGDSYTDVKETWSDAVEAMDLKTGAIRWAHQVTPNDSFLVGCGPQRPGINCPTTVGPDHDFGAAPILKRLKSGKDLVLAGQKSGQVYAFDPDDGGKIVWQTRVGKGSALGGVEWGMAADDDHLYAAVAGRDMPSLSAFRLSDGALIWRHRAPDAKCSFTGRCSNGYSGPPSLANGVLYGVNQDGHIRAFVAKTGKPVWDYDTAGRRYDTVNGVKDQRGGNLDATGMTFAGPMAFLMVGFNGSSGSSGPDNVVLAFSVDGK